MSGEVMRPEKGGNPRAAQTRIKGRNASAAGGQRAHDMRMGPQPAYVDQSRSHLNRVLLEPQTGAQLRAISEKRRALRDTARGMKSNASVAIVGIITFGHEAQTIFEELTPDQQDAAYLETAEAIATRLNSPLTGLVVHADESAPHAHFQLPAYDLTGHPISETAKRGVLREIQTLTGEIMGRHAPGIERGNSKASRLQAGASPADVVNRQVNQLHAELPAEIAAKEAERDAVQADLEKHQRHLTKAKTDLEKAIAQTGEESAKVEKIRKRAATYEKRVGAAQAELERLTSEQAAQQAALDKITRGKEKAQDELSQIEGQQVEARADLAAVETRKAETTVELDGLNSAVAQKKNEHRELADEESRLGSIIAELERAVEAAKRAIQDRDKAKRAEARKEALAAAAGALGAVWEALPAVTPWGRRKRAAEAWFEAQAEAGNHRLTIDHLKLSLTNMRDPRDIARTERFIAQHQEQLAALRREADLRANESPKQTEQRHEAERKAEEAAKRHRRENPPPPSPEELERRRQAELARLERMKKADQLERIGHDVRVLIQQKAPNAWAKAQHDHPGNHDEAQRAARRVIRHEVNTAVGSRVWPGQVDEIFQRITRETFTMPKPQPTLAPEPKPIDKSQPRPRPKGPDYGM